MLSKSSAIILSGLLVWGVACKSAPPKEVPPPTPPAPTKPPVEPELKTRAVDNTEIVEAANQKLLSVPMLALPAFKSSYKQKRFAAEAEKTLDVVKGVLPDLPEGYVIEITGHSNPYPPGSKSKTRRLSTQRARKVYDYFVQEGVDKERLRYRGVGSEEYDDELSHKNNRRVTFRVVKATQSE